MIDEWSGFADLMASLIEKYAADLDLDNLPDPKTVWNQQDDVLLYRPSKSSLSISLKMKNFFCG